MINCIFPVYKCFYLNKFSARAEPDGFFNQLTNLFLTSAGIMVI